MSRLVKPHDLSFGKFWNDGRHAKSWGRVCVPLQFEISNAGLIFTHCVADKAELEGMITNLGLGDVRSSRLILFSRQYAESAFNQRTEPVDGQTAPFPWSPILAPTKSPKKSLPTKDMTGLTRESVYPFAGVGQYAMDSFAIYSPLLPGGGAPRDEAYWLEPDVEGGEVEEVGSGSLLPRKAGTRDVSDRDDSGDEWRKVMPNGEIFRH
jgi:hypothetical protein